MSFLKHLADSKFIFLASIIIAFLIPEAAEFLKPMIVPVLMIMMTFSIKDVGFHHIKKKQVKNITLLLILNYVVLTGLYIIMTKMFVQNPLYQKAMLIFAVMPPAVGIISLSFILKGDTKTAFLTEFVGYALSILLIPFLTLWLFGSSVNPLQIIKVLAYVIIIPFIASRVLHYIEKKKKPVSSDITKTIINICYGISFYIIIGLNKNVFITNFGSLVQIIIVFFLLEFCLGALIYLFFKTKVKKSEDVLYVLFGTMKNGGASTAITILLFGVAATVPLAVNAIIAPLYIIFLEWFILTEFI